MEDDVLEESTSIPRVETESGTGWRLGAGYIYEVFEESSWGTSVSLRGELSHDEVDLRFTSLQDDRSSSNAYDLVYASDSTTVGIDEAAVWAAMRVFYAPGEWGMYFDVAGTLFSSVTVDGEFSVTGVDYELEADRTHPLMGTVGGWYDLDRWRVYADLSVGTDTGVRIGTRYAF